MSLIKPTLAALASALLIFSAFCFAQASFDIVQWAADQRAYCAIWMFGIGAMAFCGVMAAKNS